MILKLLFLEKGCEKGVRVYVLVALATNSSNDFFGESGLLDGISFSSNNCRRRFTIQRMNMWFSHSTGAQQFLLVQQSVLPDAYPRLGRDVSSVVAAISLSA